MFGDQLYLPTRDEWISRPPRPVFGKTSAADTSTSITVDVVSGVDQHFPRDRNEVLVLTNLTLELVPGASQNVMAGTVSVRDEGLSGMANLLIAESRSDPTILDEREYWTGQVLLIGGRHVLRGSANFDAGTNSNTLVMTWAGVIIPRGNIGV